jgi:hypothetical protein
LYTARLFVEPDTLHVGFGADAGDLRLPSGVAPFTVTATPMKIAVNGTRAWNVSVHTAGGTSYDLANPQNRLWATLDLPMHGASVIVNGSVVTIEGLPTTDEHDTARTQVRVAYQRARANATLPWADVVQFQGVVQPGAIVGVNITV